MPFFLIPSALGVCFFLIWAFIGGMIIRDSHLAAQREVDSDVAILPNPISRGPHSLARRSKGKSARRNAVRFAS
jgi:hypothetical protein